MSGEAKFFPVPAAVRRTQRLLVSAVVLGCAASLALAESSPARGVLEFLDGSVLHGRLQSMNPERGVGWEHPEAKSLIEFRPANLAAIIFDTARPIVLESRPTCHFRFHNGDELYGHLASIDEGHVELETWFGGSLKAPRDAVHSISFYWKGFNVLYEGPNNLDGWVLSKGQRGWQYREGSFVTSEPGVIGREFPMPPAASIAFDLSWTSSFNLSLTLFTPTIDRFDYSTSSYMFYIGAGTISLQRMQSGVGVTTLGRADIPALSRKSKVRLEFRVNKDEGTLAVLADGQLVQRWKDNAGFVAKGGGVVFSSQMEGPVVRIGNLRIAEWDGRFDTDRVTNAPPESDFVLFANRDKVAGQVQSMRESKLVLKAAQTALDIPMSRVSQIVLGRAGAATNPASPWEVRAHVAGGGSVAFQLDQWERDRVQGTSATFGKLALNPQSIRQLQFNLAKSKQDSVEQPGDASDFDE